MALIATGIYLLLGTVNAFSLTPEISESWFSIFGIEAPHFQSLSLGLLILFFILNFDTLVNAYLDYKEAKQIKEKK